MAEDNLAQTEFCVYCGDPATDRDHVIPSSYSQAIKTFGDTSWVWACRECNELLSNKMLVTVPIRAAYLADALKSRHKALLHTAKWTEEELSDLGPMLQQRIRAALIRKNRISARILWCKRIAIS